MSATVPPNLQLRTSELPGRWFKGHDTLTVKLTCQLSEAAHFTAVKKKNNNPELIYTAGEI